MATIPRKRPEVPLPGSPFEAEPLPEPEEEEIPEWEREKRIPVPYVPDEELPY